MKKISLLILFLFIGIFSYSQTNVLYTEHFNSFKKYKKIGDKAEKVSSYSMGDKANFRTLVVYKDNVYIKDTYGKYKFKKGGLGKYTRTKLSDIKLQLEFESGYIIHLIYNYSGQTQMIVGDNKNGYIYIYSNDGIYLNKHF